MHRIFGGVCGLLAAAAIALAAYVHHLGPPPIDRADALSVTVLDRDDNLLRAFTTADGRWRLPLELNETDPRYLAMLIAYEDKAFRRHSGVDPRSILRAGLLLARHGRLMSGASTLTMQVARLLEGTHRKTAAGKLEQMVRAVQIERRLSKDDILRLYLRLAPFGGNIEGVRAASLAYLGKEPRRLSLGEAALLVAIPQSPEFRRPDRHPDAARRARDRVLVRAQMAGLITPAEAADARAERMPLTRDEFPKLAPHFAESLVERDKARLIHRLTLDARAQRAFEDLAREHAKSQGSGLSVAIIAVEHTTGEVIAHVGSAGYLDETRSGAVDMTRAVRSPGSTLKPLIYGLAFEAGIAHPETLIEDRPVRFGTYTPKNFDHDWHGTVSIREALAQSLNIPAVKMLDAVGPLRLYGRMTALGLNPVLPTDAEPSLAIALGGIGLRLDDLATLYAGIARGGEAVALTRTRDRKATTDVPTKARLLSPVAAWYIAEILRNAPAPANAKPGQIAYKTGTSYGLRDAWSVGFDGRHTIAVWVGRPDGAAVPGLSGRHSAAPLLFDAFQRLAERRTPLPPAPHGVLKSAGPDLPPALRRFRERGDEPEAEGVFRDPPVEFAFPIDRAEVEVQSGDGLLLKARGGALPLTWLVDGAPVDSDPSKRELTLADIGHGFVKLTVIDARGRADRVVVRVR